MKMTRKSDNPWTEGRLLQMIDDKVEESFQLDYKGAGALERTDKKKTEITKDVSSFANSAGGTIIYGMAEHDEKEKEHLPERIDPVDRREFSREWLDQIIGGILPPVHGLRIFPVTLSSGENHVAYVVEIPKGETAHQAADGKYYRRVNFGTEWMRDHEIKDVMNRRKHPKLKASAAFVVHGTREGVVQVGIENDSDIIARDYGFTLFVPTLFKGRAVTYATVGCELACPDKLAKQKLFWYEIEFTNTQDGPLFPHGMRFHKFPFEISEEENASPFEPSLAELRWKVFADEMPFFEGSRPLAEVLVERSEENEEPGFYVTGQYYPLMPDDE